MTPEMTELIGYLASILIVVSLLMSSLYRLRVINLVGAVVFTVYGVLIGSIPVIATNGAIVLIDIYYLLQLQRDRAHDAYFEVVSVPVDSPLLERFITFHLDDARRFQPEFTGLDQAHHAWAVLRDGVPVGVVLAEVDGEVADLVLDYVTPAHRDQRAGTRFFTTPGLFAPLGVTRLRVRSQQDAHRRYLAAMGFAPTGADTFERTSP